MTTLIEGGLEFVFAEDCTATKYDEWSFYRNQFANVPNRRGSKAVDFLCIHQDIAWLIEVKDYRAHRRDKDIGIAEEVALKVRDTLAGLAAARLNSSSLEERSAARRALTKQWRIALHLEQPIHPNRLHPVVMERAPVLEALTMAVRAIDPHPIVVDSSSEGGPWRVRRFSRAGT